jgi:drug/metabolite transporter (DMT)-like permease
MKKCRRSELGTENSELLPTEWRMNSLEPYFGQLAALGTALAWSFSSIFFTMAGRKVGSEVVNRTRLLFAVIFVMIMHLLLEGQIFPFDAEPFRFGWLALSGIIGYLMGDGFLFQAFIMIGPRLSMLLMALAPVFSAVFGYAFFGEKLSAFEIGGMMLALAGIGLVVSDSQPASSAGAPLETRHYVLGVVFGIGAAMGQASGLVASRIGLEGGFPALSGNLIRLVTATSVIWIITLLRGQARQGFGQLREHPEALRSIAGGALVGPSIGVWLSLIALQLTELGIAATLMSLTPIFLLATSRIFFKERISARAIIGTAAAVAGTALLFLEEYLVRWLV